MRQNPQNSSTSGGDIVLFAAMGLFTLFFWGGTLLVWQALAPPFVEAFRPPIIFTLFAFPLPVIGYLVMTNWGRQRVGVVNYSLVQGIALVIWLVAVWLWLQAHFWQSAVSVFTFPLVFFLFLLPYWSLARVSGVGGASVAAPGNAPASTAAPTSASHSTLHSIEDGVNDWLVWLGNGENHRGVMVLMIFIFWSLLYWNWPGMALNVFTFSVWGLVTILGLFVLRAIFKPVAPGQGVPGAGDPKSKK